MTRQVLAELLILRKRAGTWILLGLWSLLAVFFAYVVPYALDPEDATGGIRPFLPASLTGTLLEGFPFFGGVFALMLGVFALGSEYGWDTLKALFTQRPRRLRVFAAKLAALAIVLVPFVLLPFAGGAVASFVIAQIEDAPVHYPSAWLLLRAIAGGWLILATWGALGVLLGVLTRGHVARDRHRDPLRARDRGAAERVRRQRERARAADAGLPARQRLLARDRARRHRGVDPVERARRLLGPDRRQRASARGPRRDGGGVRGRRRARPAPPRRGVS